MSRRLRVRATIQFIIEKPRQWSHLIIPLSYHQLLLSRATQPGPDIFILTKCWPALAPRSPAAPAINVAPTELFQWAWWLVEGGEVGGGGKQHNVRIYILIVAGQYVSRV